MKVVRKSVWKHSSHLKHFSQDIEIIINEERLYAQGMDGSQAALFELSLKSDWFTSYEVDEDVVLGINCELNCRLFSIV